MKRILSLFLAALMVLSLAACGAEPAAPEASEEPAVTEAPAEEPAAAETPAEELASSGTHIVVDFKGEETEVPDEIDRVVILGRCPPLRSTPSSWAVTSASSWALRRI